MRGPGRPRGAGLARQIRDATNEGAELVEFYLRVARGEECDHRLVQRSDGSPSIEAVPPSLKDRMIAAEFLAARGFGKVPDQVVIEATKVDAVIIQFEQLPTADALALYQLSRKFLPAPPDTAKAPEPAQPDAIDADFEAA